jgi:hypothetical protein
VNEPSLADIDPGVAEAVEEDEVAGLEMVTPDLAVRGVLGAGVVRHPNTELAVDEAGQAGTIESTGARATPTVRGSHELLGVLDEGGTLWWRGPRGSGG